MAAEFSLSIYPWVYLSKCDGDAWEPEYIEKRHLSPAEEEALPDAERERLYRERNEFPGLPLVNYTTQYAMACFEGLKAFPQPDGSLKLFRPRENAIRMKRSMEGLYMPGVPVDEFVAAARGVVARNQAIGFAPAYDPAWERDDFASGHSVYIRPFSLAEGGIGVNLSQAPWFVVVSTRVGSYFAAGGSSATITTRRIRATPGGTGWIKCSANYVTSALAKREAEVAGYLECVFLDAEHHRYVEEGSSCNLFFVLGDGRLVTPALGDTILPGITRRTIMELAAEEGITVEERPVAVEGGARRCRGGVRHRHGRRRDPFQLAAPRRHRQGVRRRRHRAGGARLPEDAEGRSVRGAGGPSRVDGAGRRRFWRCR